VRIVGLDEDILAAVHTLPYHSVGDSTIGRIGGAGADVEGPRRRPIRVFARRGGLRHRQLSSIFANDNARCARGRLSRSIDDRYAIGIE